MHALCFGAVLFITRPCTAITTIPKDAGVPNAALLTRSAGGAAADAGAADAALIRSGGAVAWRPVPTLTINLDLPPEQRYVGVATRFNSSIWHFYTTLFAHDAALTNALYAMVDKRGPESDGIMRGEIQGIVATTRLPAKFVQGVQALYELQTLMVPVVNGSSRQDSLPRRYRALERWPLRGPGCTGIVATNTADGTVIHARNMDLAPVKLFAPLVYEGVFTRNGSVVFRAEMVAGYVSLLTGYRPGAYVVERNTRYPAHKGGNREMLDNLLGGVPLSGWTLRRMLESISTYDEARAKVQSAPFVATEYVVMSGVRQGHIVARDPASVAHLSTLGPAAYVIVTNFDYWWHDVREYFDPTGGHLGLPRRVAAQRILNASLNAGLALTPELMNATISADGVLADTIFQAVADVEVGLWAIAQPALP